MGAQASLEITADNSGFLKAIAESQAALQKSFGEMKDHIEGITKSFQAITGAIQKITALLAGGGAFKEIIDTTQQWAEAAVSVGRSLGVSTEEASAYNVAIREVGGTSDDLITATRGLDRQLKTHEENLNKMGITTRDANGNLLDQETIFQNAISAVNEYKAGTDRNLAAQTAFGRGVTANNPVFRLHIENLEETRKRALDLGLVVGSTDVAAFEANRKALADMSLVGVSFSNIIGKQLIPVMVEIGAVFSTQATTGGKVFGQVLVWIGQIALEVWGGLRELGTVLGGLGAAAVAVLHGNFSEAKSIMKDMSRDLDTIVAETDKAIDKLGRAKELSTATAEPPKPPADKNFALDDPDKDRVGKWQIQLEQIKATFIEQAAAHGQLVEYSKQQEIAYWTTIRNQAGLSAAEIRQIDAKIAADRLALDKAKLEGSLATLKNEETAAGANLAARLAAEMKYLDAVKNIYGQESKQYADAQKSILETKQKTVEQQRQIDSINIQGARQRELALLQNEEAAAKERFNLGQITLKELIVAEQKYQAERYALQVKALTDELNLLSMNPNSDPKLYASLMQQIETAATVHNAAMLKINQQAEVQQQALVKKLTDSMTSGFANAFKGIITGQESVRKAFVNIFQSILDVVISTVAKMIAQWITQHTISMALSKQEQGSNAATAATGAGASAASIPYIGWAIAIGAMAAVFAAATAYHAESGFDVPQGMTPSTKLHPREMVLPERYGNVIRDIADKGGDVGGGDHYHLSAFDGKSMEKMFNSQRGRAAIMGSMKKANLRGNRVTRTGR